MRTPFLPAGGKTFFWPAAFIAMTMLGVSLSAAPPKEAPEAKGAWRKAKVSNQLSWDEPNRQDDGEYARVFGKLNAITAVLRKSPFLASPRGFDIMPSLELKNITPYDSHRKGFALSAKLTGRMQKFLPYSPFVEHYFYLQSKSCPTCPAEGSPRWTGGLRVHVNNLFDIYPPGTVAVLEDRGVGFFIAPLPAKPVGGFPAYEDGRVVVLTRSKRPILMPVSNREFLLARIRGKEEQMAEQRMKTRAGSNRRRRTPAQMREAMNRQEKLFIRIGKPKLAARMKAAMELQIKQIEEREKSGNSPEAQLAVAFEKYMQGATEYVNAMRKRLAAMSPQEKKRQVYLSGKREYQPSMVASKDVEYARPLIKFNRRFFRRNKDKTKYFVLVVVFHGFRDRTPALTPAKRRLLQSQIDWKGLYELLE